MRASHFGFVFLGNALPVAAGLWGGLNAGEILLLLYAESLVGTMLNNHRVVLHRRLSRKRGHFTAFEESDGTLHARGLSFPPATGVTIFLFAVYGFFVWVVFPIYGLSIDAQLLPYLLMSMAVPLVEYLIQRPGLGAQPFAWIEERGQDTGGRLIAFGAMIPVGAVALMAGPTAGTLAMAVVKGLLETLWHGLFQALRQKSAKLPGLGGDPNIQREWRKAVAEYGQATAHAEDVLDASTFHRLITEAGGDFSHAGAAGRVLGERATFTSDADPAIEASDASASPGEPQVSGGARETFHARARRRSIELLCKGEMLGQITAPTGLQLWSGRLDGRDVVMKVAAPWNRFTWQICIDDKALATARQPRAFGLFRMLNRFRVQLSAGEFHWARRNRESSDWELTDTDGEVVHGWMTSGDFNDPDDMLEIPEGLTAADALFLAWLRLQGREMSQRSR